MRKLIIIPFLVVIIFYGCESSIVDDPSTLIQFSVSERSYVKLTIENSYNTLIAIIMDTEMPAGSHEVSFDASNLAEGNISIHWS